MSIAKVWWLETLLPVRRAIRKMASCREMTFLPSRFDVSSSSGLIKSPYGCL